MGDERASKAAGGGEQGLGRHHGPDEARLESLRGCQDIGAVQELEGGLEPDDAR